MPEAKERTTKTTVSAEREISMLQFKWNSEISNRGVAMAARRVVGPWEISHLAPAPPTTPVAIRYHFPAGSAITRGGGGGRGLDHFAPVTQANGEPQDHVIDAEKGMETQKPTFLIAGLYRLQPLQLGDSKKLRSL